MKPKIRLHDDEQILIERQPKMAVIWYWMVMGLLRRGFLMVIIVFWVFITSNQSLAPFFQNLDNKAWVFIGGYPLAFIIGLFLIVVGLIYAWLYAMQKQHWYFITDERCINFLGFLGINKQIILFNNIVDVNIRQNFLEKLLGLSSVVLDVPSFALQRRSSRGSIYIVGLTPEDAEKIAHLIGEKMRENVRRTKSITG